MKTSDDRFWESIAPALRRAEGFDLPDVVTMNAELAAIEAEPLSESQIDEMFEAALTGNVQPRRWSVALHEEPDESFGSIRDEAMQLNRNLGDDDAEVEDLLEQQRREALSDGVAQEGESDSTTDEGAESGDGGRTG